ncbi:Arrestin domain-containing protein 2 [Gryllus bimaculatus]|nr:Arrestin domain-containing protein 2 [Gryllus bimaculatus]
MGLKRFDVYFDNPDATYYGGQTVSGRLFLHLDATKRIRGIEVRVRGEGEVRWTETRQIREDGKMRPSHEYFRGHEQYFDNKYYVLGGTGSDIMLQPGDHCYPFSIVLPDTLPCSYEGRFGHIRYIVKAILERPWKHHHDAKAAFTVINHFDLNIDPKLKDPFVLSREKWLGWWCCRSGPLGLSLRGSTTGVVPGQNLPVTVEMENSTRQMARAELYSARRDVVVSTPIMVGTVPLKQFWPILSPIPLTPQPVKIADELEIQPVPTETPSPYPELPPPFYEECSQGSHNIRDPNDSEYTRGCLDFMPHYPTYNFDQ